MMSAPSHRLYKREEVHAFANALVKEMVTPEFVSRAKEAAVRTPIPSSDDDLLARYEEVQERFIRENFKEDGVAVMEQLRLAAKTYPDKDTENVIKTLCLLTESQLLSIANSMPELKHLAPPHVNGAPWPHGHAHGDAHGHSHNGQPCNGQHGFMPPMTPDAMQYMQMGMQTLTSAQRETLARVQKSMMEGSSPSAEDVQHMAGIRQHMMSFMATMQHFNNSNRN